MRCHKIWLSLITAFGLVLASTNAQDVLGEYEIGPNRMQYYANKIDLYFPVNDLVADGAVSVLTFSDSDCSVSIVGNDYLVPEITYDSNPNPTGSSNREIKVQYTIDYDLVEDASSVYTQLSKGEFKLNFCVSFILLSGPGGNPLSAIDTEITVELKMDDKFGEEVQVGPTDRDENLAQEIYTVEGFLCDDNNERILYRIPKAQGSVTKICVKPTDDALEDNVYMRRIDSFIFQREFGPDDDKITQGAISGGQTLPLTELTCRRGSELCHFSTILNAKFYDAPGTVFGFGEAWLQFGTGNSRRLQMRIEAEIETGIQASRSLEQLDGGVAGTSYWDLDFYIIPSLDFTYNAEAYECDQWNRPAPDPKAKRYGTAMRVCVRPDLDARSMGVRMYGIESWNFTRDEFTQSAVDHSGHPSADGLTVIACIPGSIVCSFRTEFIQEFFLYYGTVQGFGNVLLQYADDSSAVQRRLEPSIPVIPGREMQEEINEMKFDQVIARSSLVRLETLVTEEVQFEDPCEFDHEVTEWWIDEDINDRYMYIGILVGTLIGICSLLLCCWCLPLCYKNEGEEHDKQQNVEVNVDIKSDQHEEQHSKKQLLGAKGGSDGLTESDSSSRDGLLKDKRGSRTVPHGGDEGKPTDDDVCFDQKSHPGTKTFKKLVKKVAKEMDKEYCPAVYKAIKKKANGAGSRFYVGKGPFFEPEKSELIVRIGLAYTNAFTGGSSNDLLLLEDNEKKKSKKSIKKSSSRRSSGKDGNVTITTGSKKKIHKRLSAK